MYSLNFGIAFSSKNLNKRKYEDKNSPKLNEDLDKSSCLKFKSIDALPDFIMRRSSNANETRNFTKTAFEKLRPNNFQNIHKFRFAHPESKAIFAASLLVLNHIKCILQKFKKSRLGFFCFGSTSL